MPVVVVGRYYDPTGVITPGTFTRTEWTGAAGDGDWSNASNWDPGVPGASDTAILASTSDTISASDQSSVGLLALRIGPGFTGIIDGLRIHAAELTVNQVTGSVRLIGTFVDVYVMGTDALADALHFDDDSPGDTSEVNHLFLMRGNVTFADATKLDDAYVYTGSGAESRLTLGASMASVSSIVAPAQMPRLIRCGYRGNVYFETAALDNHVHGGYFRGAGMVSNAAIGLDVSSGGTVDTDGNLGVVTAWPGSQITMTRSPSTQFIAAGLTTYPGSRCDLDGDSHSITIGTTTYYGGDLGVPGKTISVA